MREKQQVDANIRPSNNPWDTAAGILTAREAGAIVGSSHTMNARATIAASPKVIADFVELIAETQKAAKT
ncbi:hypothetical protein [Nonomuraea endophytica]|uniref:hypothetical protein n=1 Tax=Nonomuraea endophytica TaxID=714136 RepID=UPI0037CA8339